MGMVVALVFVLALSKREREGGGEEGFSVEI